MERSDKTMNLKLFHYALDWDNALKRCQDEGGRLATFETSWKIAEGEKFFRGLGSSKSPREMKCIIS